MIRKRMIEPVISVVLTIIFQAVASNGVDLNSAPKPSGTLKRIARRRILKSSNIQGTTPLPGAGVKTGLEGTDLIGSTMTLMTMKSIQTQSSRKRRMRSKTSSTKLLQR